MNLNFLMKLVDYYCKILSQIKNCRYWFENKATYQVFAKRVENWLNKGLNKNF